MESEVGDLYNWSKKDIRLWNEKRVTPFRPRNLEVPLGLRKVA